jgi:predicted membrane protein
VLFFFILTLFFVVFFFIHTLCCGVFFFIPTLCCGVFLFSQKTIKKKRKTPQNKEKIKKNTTTQ